MNLLSRRTALLSLLGATLQLSNMSIAAAKKLVDGGKLLTLTPEQMEGPFYISNARVRRNITEGMHGVPLRFRIGLVTTDGRPVHNMAVDLWHCDPSGNYSGYGQMAELGEHGLSPNHLQPPPPPAGDNKGLPPVEMHLLPTNGSTYLRGTQISDSHGFVTFDSIFPGAYSGRTVHAHLKVSGGKTKSARQFNASHVCHTGQIFFPEEITASVLKMEPYSQHQIVAMKNSEDMVYEKQGGSGCIAEITSAPRSLSAVAYVATSILVIDPNYVS